MIESTPNVKGPPASEICWALLERVASSPELRRAPRLREFLFYVGRRSLKDRCDHVHETEIGIAVFGRPDTYDTSVDNIVRANATELRKRIEAYFESEGLDETLIMEIPRGSYIPVFRHRPPQPHTAAEPHGKALAPVSDLPGAIPNGRASAGHRLWMTAGLVVLLLTIGCCVTLWIENRDLQRMLYPWRYSPSVAALWSEFLDGDQTTDVVMEDSGFLLVQNFSKQTFSFNDYLNRTYISQLQAQGFSPEIHAVLNTIAGKNLGRAAEVRLVQRILALDPLAKNLHLYHAREYMPALITQHNVILFGNPTSNPWEELFENRLNFTEKADSANVSPVTNHAPAAGEQQIYTPTDTIQYCVVAYLPDPGSNGKILLIQGTTSEATEAGGDFLLSEDKLSSFLKKLHGTKLPYFELLLKASYVTGTPLTTSIEAYRTYPDLH